MRRGTRVRDWIKGLETVLGGDWGWNFGHKTTRDRGEDVMCGEEGGGVGSSVEESRETEV